MSVQMMTASPRVTVSVSADNDPYKKYWWLILVGFIFTGAWLCLPGMESSVGSTHVSTTAAPDPKSEQNLDSVENPNGAQGGALDLSMDGSKKRKDKDAETFESMLYQAPPEAGAAAPGAPLGAASGSASLAQQLKSVGDAKKKDEAGWTEKAQSGFSSPRLNGSGLSGAGSSAGGSSASAGGSAFGSGSAQVSFGSTRGLNDDAGEKASSGGLAALRTAAKTAGQAAASRSNDSARAGVGSFFDGSKGRNAGIGAVPAGGGTYAALDAAPANLKLNNPELNKKEIKDPPGTPVPSAADNQMGKQLMMMAASALIGGMIPGVGGQMVMMAGMMMMQQQQAKADAAAQTQSQAASNRINGVVH
ncbi:MAG: hypothetical protein ACHQ51_11235 [Elusimicrobiota bacterium]